MSAVRTTYDVIWQLLPACHSSVEAPLTPGTCHHINYILLYGFLNKTILYHLMKMLLFKKIMMDFAKKKHDGFR